MSTPLYLRKASLVVSGALSGRDLSALQFRFQVTQHDIQTPNVAVIRVYNLSDSTSQQIQEEFTSVILQAGYQDGPYGVVFNGAIKQVRRGRENAVDSYLDILAADGDEALNFAVTNQSLAAGSTPQDQLNAHADAFAQYKVTQGTMPAFTSTALPRGKAIYTMARDAMRDFAASQGCSYSVQNGKLTLIPLDGFKPGEAVVINSQTGMVGVPEQTEDGITVTSLMNPNLAIGCKLRINEKDINQAAAASSGVNLNLPTGTTNSADVANAQFLRGLPGIGKDDGVYRIYVINHHGDTRGNDWYSEIVCLSIDPTLNEALTPGLLQRGAA